MSGIGNFLRAAQMTESGRLLNFDQRQKSTRCGHPTLSEADIQRIAGFGDGGFPVTTQTGQSRIVEKVGGSNRVA